jgi:hypothetical protein
LATLAYGLVALFHIRFSSYAQIAFIFALAGFIDSTFLAAAPIKSDISRGLVRGCAIALIFVGPIITGKVISNAGFENFADPGKVKTASEICEMPKLAGYLNDETIFPDSEVVLAFLDLGPQILYYTRHQIIGAPYHRNGEGILASHEIFSTNDTEKARSMMAERGVGLILLCPNSPEQNFYTATNGAEALYGRLSANDPPDWIEPLPLPDELRDGFKLFRLRL